MQYKLISRSLLVQPNVYRNLSDIRLKTRIIHQLTDAYNDVNAEFLWKIGTQWNLQNFNSNSVALRIDYRTNKIIRTIHKRQPTHLKLIFITAHRMKDITIAFAVAEETMIIIRFRGYEECAHQSIGCVVKDVGCYVDDSPDNWHCASKA